LFDGLALLFCEPSAADPEHDASREGEVRNSPDADLLTDGTPELEPLAADNEEDGLAPGDETAGESESSQD